MKKIVLGFFLVCYSGQSFGNDVLILSNSMMYQGKVTKIKHCMVTFKSADNKYMIPASDIFSIEFENKNDRVYNRCVEKLEIDPSKCVNARLDAHQYHGKKSSHIALGFLFGPLAIMGTAMSNPTPQKGQLTNKMSTHTDLFDDPTYLNCYKKKAKGRLIGAESIGMGISLLMILFITPTYLAGN